MALGAHSRGILYDPPLPQVYPPWVYGGSTPVSLEHMLCFHPCPGWTSHQWDQHPHALSASTHHSSSTRITLHFVQKDLAVPLFLSSAKPVVPLAAVCVHACACFFSHQLHIYCMPTVPGAVADLLWVCLLMPLLLLWGPHLCSLSPYCYLCQSGCLRFCVSLSFCRTLFVSLPSLASDSACWPLWVSEGPRATLTSPAHLFTPSLTLAGGFPQSHF